MPRFLHANLGVPPELAKAEVHFLVGVLGYRHVAPPPPLSGFGAHWYEADDGTQVHLSLDPNHVPAAMAHTAIDVTGEFANIEERLNSAGLPFEAGESRGSRVLLCRDPAGNRWELRG